MNEPSIATPTTTRADTRHIPPILLVDDQPARLLTYESVLNGLNVQCVRATSGHEALKRLLERDFAVILLDVNMPGMGDSRSPGSCMNTLGWNVFPSSS